MPNLQARIASESMGGVGRGYFVGTRFAVRIVVLSIASKQPRVGAAKIVPASSVLRQGAERRARKPAPASIPRLSPLQAAVLRWLNRDDFDGVRVCSPQLADRRRCRQKGCGEK